MATGNPNEGPNLSRSGSDEGLVQIRERRARRIQNSYSYVLGVGLLAAFWPGETLAGSLAIQPDGEYGDWTPTAVVHKDPTGDAAGGAVDFGKLYVANDDDQLFIRFDTGAEIALQDNNGVVLYVDSDNLAGTGLPLGDIGVEFLWRFGERTGAVFRNDGSRAGSTNWLPFGFRQEPTTSASEFEIAFSRYIEVLDENLLGDPKIAIVLRAERDGVRDTVPDTGKIVYAFQEDKTPPPTPIPLAKRDPSHLRVVSHNVLSDGWFDNARQSAFDRLYRALRPDIFCFQEFRESSAAQVKAKVEALFGGTWFSEKNGDNVVVSRYFLSEARPIDGNLGVLAELPDARFSTDLFLIDVHFPCCDNDGGRQREVDSILAFVRDLHTRGEAVDIPPRTPIVITGDMNLVGLQQQIRSLQSGDIVDEAAFGPDHAPDWDGSNIADPSPRHIGGREVYTWRSNSSTYMPGRLDYFLYTDSVVSAGNHFVLWTPDMSPEQRAAAELKSSDSPCASDHIPVVIDLVFP